MSRFDFTLKHVPGVRMEKADRLSRRPSLKVGVEKDNENQKLIKEECIRGIIEVVVEGLEIVLINKIKIAKRKNKEVVRVVEEIKKAGIRALKGNK